MDPTTSIPAFYAGQSIFLTGATGFLGKVYIEKILRSCPDVREIFLLIRPKKGMSINERLEKILNLPLYEKLRKERPSNLEKLIPVSGDTNEKELGLSVVDRQMLAERVTIIIHAAASVKFNDSLKCAIFTNTRGTRDICILAQSMRNLLVLVYVGTAYAHTRNPVIEEKTYSPITDWRKIIDVAENLDEHTLNIFTAKYLDDIPNTYILSKTLAENIIQEYSSSLPCVIVRPSLMMPSLKDPFPGWIDNVYGPIGLFTATGKGILRVMHTNKYAHANYIPIDMLIRAILVVSWKFVLTSSTSGTTLFILNCVSDENLWPSGQQIDKIGANILEEIPFEGILIPGIILTDNFAVYYILTILLHMLPAMLVDLILKLFGRRPMLVKIQRNIYVANCALKYFMLHEWKFDYANSLALISSILPEDREMFSFDFANIDILEYSRNYLIGVKKFLLHEDMSRLYAIKAQRRRMHLLVKLLKIIIAIGVLWMIYRKIYS